MRSTRQPGEVVVTLEDSKAPDENRRWDRPITKQWTNAFFVPRLLEPSKNYQMQVVDEQRRCQGGTHRFVHGGLKLQLDRIVDLQPLMISHARLVTHPEDHAEERIIICMIVKSFWPFFFPVIPVHEVGR